MAASVNALKEIHYIVNKYYFEVIWFFYYDIAQHKVIEYVKYDNIRDAVLNFV
jgi:hypothetical protein